jgi:microcompartment protein CcmK/EutM
MLIGKVVGSVVATRKDEKLQDRKLLLVQVHDHENKPKEGQYVVAVDSVGAGPDDMILYATGSSARQTTLTENRPCDAVIMAIVDSWDLGGENVYEKWTD